MADEYSLLTELRLLFGPYLELARQHVNGLCSGLEAWQVVAYTFGFTLILVWLWEFVFQPDESFTSRLKKTTFKILRNLPIIKGKVQEQLDATSLSMEKTFHRAVKGHDYVQTLPASGMSEDQVLAAMKKYKTLAEVKWAEGACSGTVYSGEDGLTKLATKVYGEFAWSNPLHADVFPDVRKMEAEVVRMTCNLFNGDSDSCGCVTSGGTESIMLACKAYRDRAIARGVKHPEMVVPVTVHAAFDKAAQYFRIKIVHTPVDKTTYKADTRAMFRAVNKNTCMHANSDIKDMLVAWLGDNDTVDWPMGLQSPLRHQEISLAGSCPQFPHGIIDPIEDIAKIGRRYDIPVHVDCCLGGFLVPFMKKAGYELPPFDFSVPGVTSISADTHKYGFAPKGSSVVMYKNEEYRNYQFFVAPDWPGGVYASPTFAGSRAGAIIAACWATMMYIGEDGYVESTRKIITATRELEQRLSSIPGLFIMGQPLVSVIALASRQFNIYRLSDALTARGWNLSALQFPSSIHLTVTLVHTQPGVIDRLVRDVEECTAEILKNPKAECEGQGAMYGMAQSIPDRSLVAEIGKAFFNGYYSTNKRSMENGTK